MKKSSEKIMHKCFNKLIMMLHFKQGSYSNDYDFPVFSD